MSRRVEPGQPVEGPLGAYDKVLVPQDWTPLKLDVIEHKFDAWTSAW